MKVLVVLAMALAVSSAAFSDIIAHQAGGLVKDAFHQIKVDLNKNVRARNAADVSFQNEFVHAMEQHVDNILGEMDVILNAGQAISGSVAEQMQAAARDISLLAQFPAASHAESQAAFQTVFQKVNAVLGQDEQKFGRQSVAIPPQMVALIQAILARPGAQETVEATPLYQCMDGKLAAEGGLNYEYLKELNAQGKLNADFLMNSPIVQECIQEQGGVAAIVTNTDILLRLKDLAGSLDLTETAHVAIRHVLGDSLGNQIIDQLNGNEVAIRGIWDTITGGIGQVLQTIKDILNAIYESVAEKFHQLKNYVLNLLGDNWSGILELGKDAAQRLLEAIAPYYCDIGKAAATLVSRVLASFTGLTIPPAIIVAVGGKIVEIISGNPVSCS